MRVGLIGCGAIARRTHIPALKAAGAEVVAVASASLQSAQAAATECGGAEVFEGWRDLVDRAGVDAVDICTPNSLHAEIAIAAAQAGRHVLVEKPMATTVAECDAMIAAADAAGVLLMTAHNARFAPPFVAAARIVAAGDIGDVHGFRAAFGHAGPESWAPGSSWFRDRALAGGGALLDLGVHVIDMLRAVLADDVTEVSAFIRDAEAVEEDAQVLLRFAGGAAGSIHASWIARPGPDHQLTLFGAGGSLHVDLATPLTLRRAGGGKPEVVPVSESVPDVCAAFVASVSTGALPPVTAGAGRAAVSVVEAAYQSARTGRAVTPS